MEPHKVSTENEKILVDSEENIRQVLKVGLNFLVMTFF